MSETKSTDGKSVMIMTDMEPDDMFAIYTACRLSKVNGLVAVVGEGDSSMKARRMALYLELLHKDKVETGPTLVVQGLSSKTVFDKDGAEFDLKAVEETKVDSQDGFESCFGECCGNVVLALKPPRELLALHAKHPTALAGTELVMYGSFNLRSLLDRADPKGSRQRIYDMFAECRRVVLYESFLATGSSNTLTPDNAPEFFKAVAASKSEYLAAAMRLVKIWNEHNLNDSLETCTGLCVKHNVTTGADIKDKADKAQFDRNAKCAADIMPYVDTQMVLADQAMLAVYYGCPDIKPTPVKIEIDDRGYTIATPVDAKETNIFMYMKIDRAAVVAALTKAISA